MELNTTAQDFLPGAVGPFIDELPLITQANIRPYIIAILLHRGAVRYSEIIGMISPQCAVIDLKVGAWDGIEQCSIEDKTRLEMQVDDVLFDMLSSGLIRYNEDQDFWVLVKGENDQNLPRIINWISSTGGQLPQHLLLEISEEKLKQRLKNEQERATTA